MPKRKYQDVEKLLEQNPGMTIAEAGRKLGYKQELQNKGQGRVGLRNRQVDQKRAKAESMQRGEATRYKPPKVSGFDQHHKRMVMLYRPLYEGLSDADALELSKYAAAQGMPLGDVEGNYELLSTGRGGQHDQIHRYMEQQGMRPSDMPDFSKADLDNRKKAFDVLYKDFIQADIDKKTSLLIKGGAARLNRMRLKEFRADIIPGAEEMGKAIARNPVEALTGAAMNLADPDVIKSLFQGKLKEALEKGAMGAGIGAGLAEVLKVNPVQQARLASYSSKIPGVASQIPRALQIGGAVARFAGPAAMAVGGYQLADAILEGSTGAGFVDTIKQVQDKERTAEINEAAVESAAKSKQLAVEKELPKPILDSDTIEKFVTDPLNELEYGWKKLTGQV